MSRLRTLDDLLRDDLLGRPVFVRTDLNVPRDGDRILDDTRIRASAPTLVELGRAGAKVLVFSHYGRPKGKRRADQSLQPVAPALAESVGAAVAFADDCVGETAIAAARATPDGGYCLFENLRFHAGE
jgi:phosphoglycerate kinase